LPPQFEEALRGSESPETAAWWDDVYRAAWPDYLYARRFRHHKSLIDTVVVKGDPPHGVRIDEKRIVPPKSYPHIALELYHERPDEKVWLGWARDREKYRFIDVFFYGMPAANIAWLLPAQKLLALRDEELEALECAPLRENGRRRIKVWNHVRSGGRGGYHTHNLLVYPDEILPLIGGRAVEIKPSPHHWIK